MGSLIMIVASKVLFATRELRWKIQRMNKLVLLVSALLFLVRCLIASSPSYAQNGQAAANQIANANVSGDSVFNNQSDTIAKDWRQAVNKDQYVDTKFGELTYNEPSTASKLEVLRLLSKDTPSMMVFLSALSMGGDIESILRAAAEYQPDKRRDFAASAVNVLPVLAETSNVLYSGYQLEDLEKDGDSLTYSVEEVIERFFKQRQVLRPYPDWFAGQYHFLASAAELKRLQAPQKNVRWYRTENTEGDTADRPIFISLYEANSSVLIDGEERITEALKSNPKAQLPVVFIFNRLNERAVDELGYPATIKGVTKAFTEKQLMVTPAPEWQMGEYHIYAGLHEFYENFNIPEPEDFEPEAWQKLLDEARNYTVSNTSFLLVALPPINNSTANLAFTNGQLYAAWDDPRAQAAFPYVTPEDGSPLTLKNLSRQRLIFNRPDLIAALNALGVSEVPVAFYYLHSSRVTPFLKGPRYLVQTALTFSNGSTGGIICASPPCTEESPPE